MNSIFSLIFVVIVGKTGILNDVELNICLISGYECRSSFPDMTDDKFQSECLTAHNTYRAKHHAQNLNIDQEVSHHC